MRSSDLLPFGAGRAIQNIQALNLKLRRSARRANDGVRPTLNCYLRASVVLGDVVGWDNSETGSGEHGASDDLAHGECHHFDLFLCQFREHRQRDELLSGLF